MKDANPDRKNDDTQEGIINRFLQPYYFERLFQNVSFVTDEEMQCKGVDFTADGAKPNMLIDVKAQSSAKYINNPTPTFCLEVSTFNRTGTREMVGWFCNERNITEYYTYVWMNEASVDERNRIPAPENIKRVEVMTVDAKALKEFINSKLKKHHFENLQAVVHAMRDNETTRIDICHGVHFSYSPHLVEKPVNIIVHKSVLRQFIIPGTAGHCMVTRGGVRPLKY